MYANGIKSLGLLLTHIPLETGNEWLLLALLPHDLKELWEGFAERPLIFCQCSFARILTGVPQVKVKH